MKAIKLPLAWIPLLILVISEKNSIWRYVIMKNTTLPGPLLFGWLQGQMETIHNDIVICLSYVRAEVKESDRDCQCGRYCQTRFRRYFQTQTPISPSQWSGIRQTCSPTAFGLQIQDSEAQLDFVKWGFRKSHYASIALRTSTNGSSSSNSYQHLVLVTDKMWLDLISLSLSLCSSIRRRHLWHYITSSLPAAEEDFGC